MSRDIFQFDRNYEGRSSLWEIHPKCQESCENGWSFGLLQAPAKTPSKILHTSPSHLANHHLLATMKLPLVLVCATLLSANTATAYASNATAWIEFDWQPALGPITAPAMEMEIHSSIHPADKPALQTPDYDEDVIIDLMTEIYRTLHRLGPTDNKIIWPPEGGHELDLSKVGADGLEIDERVLALMRRLPITKEDRRQMIPGMSAVNFLSPKSWNRWLDQRNVFWASDGLPTIPAPPTTLILFRCDDYYMPIVVLDIADSEYSIALGLRKLTLNLDTNRMVGESEYLDDAYTETPTGNRDDDYRCDYKNWPAMSAPEYLKAMLRNYRGGIWVPSPHGNITPWQPDAGDPKDPSYGFYVGPKSFV